MDAQTAKDLLTKIAEAKEAGFSGLAGWIPTGGSTPSSPTGQLLEQQKSQLRSDATKDIFKTMLIAGGLGAAVRGLSGASNMVNEKGPADSGRVVEMPIPYPDNEEDETKPIQKKANNQEATARIGLDYFIPGMLLGAPLAAYGGWKAVDSLLDNQRKGQTEGELEAAKNKYEQSMLNAYGKSAEDLGKVVEAFDALSMGGTFPNLPGAVKGTALAYGLATLPLGYMLVDGAMQRNSQKALLQKAIDQRARRQAMNQPSELYAIPKPVKPKQEVDEEE